LVRMRPQTARHCIGNSNLGISKDLELALVMFGEQGQEEQPHGMTSQIRRDIPDPQTAVGIAVVAVTLDELSQGPGMLPVPPTVFLGNGLGVVTMMIMQSQNKMAVRFGKVG